MHDRREGQDFTAADPLPREPKMCLHDPRMQCTCETDECECPLDQRRDCPWKCKPGDATCICAGSIQR
jgi:hypothetical protein